MTGSRVPLEGVLSALLPSPAQTRLLRAALWPTARARPELLAWQAAQRRPTAALAHRATGGKLLAPLIARNLAGDPTGLDERLLTYLRTAIVREELRTEEFRRIAGLALAALDRASVPFLALKGVALGETVYPDPRHRHSRDIDLLVHRQDLERASEAIAAATFRPDGTGGPPNGPLGHQVHETGLPLVLHTGLFTFRRWNAPLDDVWARSAAVTLLGSPARVLSPADLLLHVCAHAMAGALRLRLLWAADAWYVLARYGDLDWDALVDRARVTRTGLALYATLGWLSRSLEAPVPAHALERLTSLARQEDRLGLELLLHGGWRGPGLRLGRLWQVAEGWPERAFLLRWRFLPSSALLIDLQRIRRPAEAPLFWLARPFRGLVRRATSRRSPPDRSG